MNLNVFTYDYLSWKRPINWFYNIKNFFRTIKWAFQRAIRGYSDYDIWDLYDYLTNLMADSIDTLSYKTDGYPAKEYEDVNTYEDWVKYLQETATILRHSVDDGKFYKNEYEKAHLSEQDINNFISKKYFERELEIDELKSKDLEVAFDRLKAHWYELFN